MQVERRLKLTPRAIELEGGACSKNREYFFELGFLKVSDTRSSEMVLGVDFNLSGGRVSNT